MSPRIALVAIVMCAVVAACDSQQEATADADSSTTTQVLPPDTTPITTGAGNVAPTDFDDVAACTSALPGGFQFFGAEVTSVGAVRDFRAGPPTADGEPAPMWPNAFPAATSSDPAAWCIAVDASETYAFYVATPGHPALDIGHQSGLAEPPPPGPPRIE